MNLIARVLWEREKGDVDNFNRVITDLSLRDDYCGSFEFDNLEINWFYFQSHPLYSDIILEGENVIYFYLVTSNLNFEVIIIANLGDDAISDDAKIAINSLYVFGKDFPGLESIEKRPIQINPDLRKRTAAFKGLNHFFKTTLINYKELKKPIFEVTDPYKTKGWVKIVAKKK